MLSSPSKITCGAPFLVDATTPSLLLLNMTPHAYVLTLRRIDKLMDLDPDPLTEEGQELLELVKEVEQYEERVYPIARVLPEILSTARI